jgi:hypothetical protein
MFVRVARFEGLDTSNLDETYEQFRRMARSQTVPEGIDEAVFQTLRDGVKRWMSLVDREAGASLDLTFSETAEDARKVHEALDSLSPPEGAGRRTTVGTYELMLDEQLG